MDQPLPRLRLQLRHPPLRRRREWLPLATVDSEGTLDEPGRYEYVDAEPFEGLNLYRLLRCNADGDTEVTHEIAVVHERS